MIVMLGRWMRLIMSFVQADQHPAGQYKGSCSRTHSGENNAFYCLGAVCLI